MSDDDWENAVDDIVEDKVKEEVKIETKFANEDTYDSDEEKKKKDEEKKKVESTQPVRTKTGGKDYDKMFDEKQKKKSSAKTEINLKKTAAG